jgi:hypothetical protein
MRIVMLIVLLAATSLSGCATSESLQEARAESPKRVFRHSPEAVYNAALAAAKAHKLDVVESDASGGTMRLARTGNWKNWGETIAVYLKPLDGDFTEVAIVNAPTFEFLSFSPYWDRILFDQIAAELRSGEDD